MVQVVEDSTQYLDDQDLIAIASYMKSHAAMGDGGAYDAQSRAAWQSVAALRTGDEERRRRPLSKRPRDVIKATARASSSSVHVSLTIRRCVSGSQIRSCGSRFMVGRRLRQSMDRNQKIPAYADKLTDTEIARVLTFVRSGWGNDATPVTTRDVNRLRAAVDTEIKH